jgi:hypothetical protein
MARRKGFGQRLAKQQDDEAQVVKKVSNGDGKKKAKTGPPRRVVSSQMKSRTASYGGGGFGNGGSVMGAGGNFYSPELSTDFLELPQSLHEQWAYYRFFDKNEPYVSQAISLHSILPISKVRLAIPRSKNRKMAEAAMRFCEKWVRRIDLTDRLLAITRERNLIGEVYLWCEDKNPEMPREVTHYTQRILTEEGEAVEKEIKHEDADKRAAKWLKKNYKGWTKLVCLPPENIRVRTFNFTDKKIVEMIPDSETRKVIEQADAGDPVAKAVVDDMPPHLINAVRGGGNVVLGTDPYAGSFVYCLYNKKSDYEARGTSILQCCMRSLVYRDKLRQAQTSIASRHMTPIRIVYGEDLSLGDVEDLREQVDMALMDPDYSIIANFEVRWEEMGADQRLLNLDGEYELTNRQLYAGLGITESLLTGEGSYSGDRVNLEAINTRYMLLREQLQKLVEEILLRPMCARMGFVEEDEDGDEIVLVPSLSFTRLALRDNRDTFDALYNLYTKGSLDIDTILELLNLDPVAVREKIQRDLLTVNDPTYNEMMRGIYSDAGRQMVENSDVVTKLAKDLGLTYAKPKESQGRFASSRTASGESALMVALAKAILSLSGGTERRTSNEQDLEAGPSGPD